MKGFDQGRRFSIFCLVRFGPTFFRAALLRPTRSGSFLASVSRFHSSNA